MTLAAAQAQSQAARSQAAGKTLARTDANYQRSLAKEYRQAFEASLKEMDRLTTYIAQQKAAGAPVSPSWLNSQTRYLNLQSQLATAISGYGESVMSLLMEQQEVAARAGLSGLREEVLREAGIGGINSNLANLSDFSGSQWAMLDRGALNAALNALTENTSPLKQLVNSMAGDVLLEFRKTFATGIAAGYNPKKIGRQLSTRIQGMTQGRAQLIARTEWHRAVREARSDAFTNSKVIKAWIWRSALDDRSCGICYLMHGTEHKTDERLPGHPGCRCVMVPKTAEWADLGLPGVPNSKPKIEPGASSFRRLSEKRQKQLIGQKRLDMFKSGTKLKDLIEFKPNATWGGMMGFKPLGKVANPKRVGNAGGGGFQDSDYRNPFKSKDTNSTSATYSSMETASNAWGQPWGHTGTFTNQQRESLRSYRGSGYGEINQALRGTWQPSVGTRNHIANIDSVMDASRMGSAAVLYRGTNLESLGVNSLSPSGDQLRAKIGTVITEPGYMSTATFNPFGGQVRLTVLAPKGTKGVWMSDRNTAHNDGDYKGPYGDNNGENEVMLDRGTKFVIEKVTSSTHPVTGNKFWDVEVRVVGQERKPLP